MRTIGDNVILVKTNKKLKIEKIDQNIYKEYVYFLSDGLWHFESELTDNKDDFSKPNNFNANKYIKVKVKKDIISKVEFTEDDNSI